MIERDLPNLDYIFRESLILSKINYSQSVGIIPITDIINKFRFTDLEKEYILKNSISDIDEETDLEDYVINSLVQFFADYGVYNHIEKYLENVIDIKDKNNLFFSIVDKLMVLRTSIIGVIHFYIKDGVIYRDGIDIFESGRMINIITCSNVRKDNKKLYDNSTILVGIYNVE